MAFDRFKGRPMQRVTSSLWNALMDELNALDSSTREEILKRVMYEDLGKLAYSILPDQDNSRSLGSDATRWATVYAYSGDFKDSVTVQGKSVIKDGDPITVSDLGTGAVDKISQAVSSAYSAFRLLRWGIDAEPNWVFGEEIEEPQSETELVSVTVQEGKTGYVFGVIVSASEANSFKILCGDTYVRVFLAGAGTLHIEGRRHICYAEENDEISVINIVAGSAGSTYQAGVLYAEV